ncbi:MAG: arginine--tRNA ligase [Armatimonadota bacterium]
MLRTFLASVFRAALTQLVEQGRLPKEVLDVRIEIADPKNPDHGDFACNIAMSASKVAGKNPREFAELLVEPLSTYRGDVAYSEKSGVDSDPIVSEDTISFTTKTIMYELSYELFDKIEVAGPGFINLTLNPEYVASHVGVINALGEGDLAKQSPVENPLKINVEFVSVNPNGPITIGSGRGAAYGSTLCNIFEAAGHTVHREYYINDGVNSEQMRLFAESVRALGRGQEVPEKGYKGDYVHEVAKSLAEVSFVQNATTIHEIAGFCAFAIAQTSSPTITLGKSKNGEWLHLGGAGWSHAGLSSLVDQLTIESARGFFNQVDRKLGSLGVVKDGFSGDVEERHGTDPAAQWYEYSVPQHVANIGLQRASERLMIEAQRSALAAFGVTYDTWFSEQSLHDVGTVADEIKSLAAKGIANTDPTRTKLKLAKGGKIEDVIIESQTADVDDEGEVQQAEATAEGETLWLRSTKLGDDMDRVLLRKDGRLTYIASDVAYHKDKFNRPAGADKLITILGPDHHGYIGRLTAVVAAMLLEPSELGEPCPDEFDAKLYRDENEKAACQKALKEAREKLEVQIYQLVRFMKEGKPAPMRKRDGNIYALIDLMREIGEKLKPEGTEQEKLESGKDVARFFYLMRSHDTTFDFDLDLAEKQSDENPVFYVQYAHARICSILEKAGEQGDANLALLTHPKEKTLIKRIADLPNEVSRAAEDYGVHRLTTYAIELARAFHGFYGDCKVISEDAALTAARVQLCEATKKALKETLDLLGVSAPERM